jgi:hypothetical protein
MGAPTELHTNEFKMLTLKARGPRRGAQGLGGQSIVLRVNCKD